MTDRHAHLTVVVVGAGLMGSGIAQVAAMAGHRVHLQDVDESSLTNAVSTMETSLAKLTEKGRLDASDAADSMDRLSVSRDLESSRDADIVIEAVFERLEVKQALFSRLDELAPERAVLATNTSALPITQIAAVTHRPEAVVGTHFFSPVPLMSLCELVRGYHTSDETVARARSFAESTGKTCVLVNRDIAGFVTTRLIATLAMEAARLVEGGVATADDVDTACRLGFGHAMGPLETMDLTGIDIMVNAVDNVAAETPGETFNVPGLLRRMVAAGDLGRKTGRGFYTY